MKKIWRTNKVQLFTAKRQSGGNYIFKNFTVPTYNEQNKWYTSRYD